MDGDIVQMFSINSEYGVEGFSDDNYDDTRFYIRPGTAGGALMGIYFSSNTINRKVVSPGIATFSSAPPLFNYYGYTNTQKVPFYKWKNFDTTTIFGTDTNDWYTTPPYYSQKYQDLSFAASPFSPYFNNTQTGQQGFIFQTNSQGDPVPTPYVGSDTFIVGAPYHFYFGLRKGKSAINRYLLKYFLNQDV